MRAGVGAEVGRRAERDGFAKPCATHRLAYLTPPQQMRLRHHRLTALAGAVLEGAFRTGS